METGTLTKKLGKRAQAVDLPALPAWLQLHAHIRPTLATPGTSGSRTETLPLH